MAGIRSGVRRSFAWLLLAALAAGDLSAQAQAIPPQTPANPVYQPPGIQLIFPGIIGAFAIPPVVGIPERILAGRFTADDFVDVVLHDGSEAQLVSGIDVWASGGSATIAASALASYRPEGAERDVLIGCDAAGLVRWTFATGSIVAEPLGHPAWAGATSIAIGSLGGGPAADLAGVSAGGEILVLLDFGTATPVQSSFATLSVPLEVLLLDWDGEGADEIAVRASLGVRIHTAAGALVIKFRGYHPVGAFTRVEGPEGTNRIAWATVDPSATAEFLALLWAGGSPLVTPIGAAGTSAIASADFDADGLPDLALRRGAAGDVLLLLGAPEGYDPADPDRAQTIPGIAGDGPFGTPCPIDLEGDGDSDLLWGAAGGAELHVIRSGAIDSTLASPSFGYVRFDVDDQTLGAYLAFEFMNGSQVPAGITHLQAALFRKPSAGEPTDPTPLATLLLPFAATPPPGGGGGEPPSMPIDWGGAGLGLATPIPFPQPGSGVLSPYPRWEVPLPETGTSFPSIHSIVMRYVEVDAQGAVIGGGPARVFLFTPETESELGEGGTLDSILSWGGVLSWWSTIEDIEIPPGIEPEFSSTGTLIETKPIPDVPPDEEPSFGP